jgi:hypothetical protein
MSHVHKLKVGFLRQKITMYIHKNLSDFRNSKYLYLIVRCVYQLYIAKKQRKHSVSTTTQFDILLQQGVLYIYISIV